MARTKQRRSTAVPVVPPVTLLQGELALNITAGKLWYGDDSGVPQLLTSRVNIGTATPAANMTLERDFWWHTTEKALRIYEGGAWKLVGMPTTGGTFDGHIIVNVVGGGNEVLRTTSAGITTKAVTATGPVTAPSVITDSIILGSRPFTHVPAGTIAFFATDAAPTGWVLMDGSLYPAAGISYIQLFAAIGYRYTDVANDMIGYFRVPDARGMFPRFTNHARTGAWADPDVGTRTGLYPANPIGDAAGTLQADAIASHTHAMKYRSDAPATGGVDNVYQTADGVNNRLTSATGGAETRPNNIYFTGIIKL